MFYEPREGHGLAHNPFKALVVPRPIGWISTVDPEGRVNLAPYSFYNAVSEFPPMETTLIDGELAFRQHSGGHTTGPNWPTFLKFAGRHMTAGATTQPAASAAHDAADQPAAAAATTQQ